VSRVKALRAEFWLELLKLWRQPAYMLPAIGFPLVFYILFGVLLGARGGTGQAQYMLATYGAFGVIGATMFALGVGFSLERGQGWLQLRRLTPAPISSLLASKLLAALVLAAIVVGVLMVAAFALGKVRMPAVEWLGLMLSLLLGSIPFALFGMCFGLLLSAESAPNVINLVFLPAAALGGLWFPLFMLPTLMQQFAKLLPTYHLGNVALHSIGRGHADAAVSWLTLGLFTVAAWLIARRAWARQS